MKGEYTLKGTIIYGEEFEVLEGYIVIENGVIKGVEEERIKTESIIAPCFVNAHTHIGDSILKDPPYLPLEELVQPPHGLKHRVLRESSYNQLVSCMRACVEDMLSTGTCAFSDFREGGVMGIKALNDAINKNLEVMILGRPSNKDMSYLDMCHGTGLSSTSDMDISLIKEILSKTREKKKKFAIHAGERDASDISSALDLEPDFIIHLTHAEKKHLRRVADAGIPVVVCVRSNFITDAGVPPVKEMLKEGILVAAGTDNVMLNSTSMFSEMEFLAKTVLHDDRQVFKLCTLNGAKILGLDGLGCIKKGKKARLMILTKKSNNMKGIRNPINSLVRRARPDDIVGIVLGDMVWSRSKVY